VSTGFPKETVRFLAGLKKDNSKSWFDAHRADYDAYLLEPAMAFVEAIAPRLRRIDPAIQAEPRVNGSIMRIHRDVRFSKDKTPYKTHAAAQFRHARGKDVHAPGYYLHLDPTGCFVGVGMWHPDPDSLKKIRAAIMGKPKKWKSLIGSKTFQAEWSLSGDALARAPGEPRLRALLARLG